MLVCFFLSFKKTASAVACYLQFVINEQLGAIAQGILSLSCCVLISFLSSDSLDR